MSQRKPFKSERHLALDDFCCHGSCDQGRKCPRESKPELSITEALWLVMPFIVAVVGAVGLSIAVWA